jgi:hypothetical protein
MERGFQLNFNSVLQQGCQLNFSRVLTMQRASAHESGVSERMVSVRPWKNLRVAQDSYTPGIFLCSL